MMKMKALYGNRKWRKRKKMNERDWFAFLGKSCQCKGIHREIMLMFCKSSSIETFRKIDKKVEIETEKAVKAALLEWMNDPELNVVLRYRKKHEVRQ